MAYRGIKDGMVLGLFWFSAYSFARRWTGREAFSLQSSPQLLYLGWLLLVPSGRIRNVCDRSSCLHVLLLLLPHFRAPSMFFPRLLEGLGARKSNHRKAQQPQQAARTTIALLSVSLMVRQKGPGGLSLPEAKGKGRAWGAGRAREWYDPGRSGRPGVGNFLGAAEHLLLVLLYAATRRRPCCNCQIPV